jgi:hypothetical protein
VKDLCIKILGEGKDNFPLHRIVMVDHLTVEEIARDLKRLKNLSGPLVLGNCTDSELTDEIEHYIPDLGMCMARSILSVELVFLKTVKLKII